jgi:hypothetical protein
METKLCRPKHATEKAKKRKQGLEASLFDPRPLHRRCLDVEGLKEMHKSLREKAPTIPYAKVFDPNQHMVVTTTAAGNVAKGSLLDIQLNYDSTTQQTEISNNDRVIYPSLPIAVCSSVSTNESAPTARPATPSLSKCHEIFRNTLGQSTSVIWKQERQCRLTASRFGMVVKRKADQSKSFVNSICNPADLSHIPWVKYGIENEDTVAELYRQAMISEGKSVQLFDVGLCVNPSLPHLGASLDRGVYDPSSESKYGGLEVKTCPKAGQLGISVNEAVDHPEFKSDFFLQQQNDVISLKQDHNYYYQIQGQLALTQLPWVDFVAYSGVGLIYKERVYFNKTLWETTMLPKLNEFYFRNQHLFKQNQSVLTQQV